MTKPSGNKRGASNVTDESNSIHDNSDDEDDDDDDTKGTASVNTASSSRGQKRSHPGEDSGVPDDEKKAERRKANRRSAFQSRQRRKILIEDLQRTVAALSKDNSDLRQNNDELRTQLESTLVENHQFRMQQALSGASGGANGSSALQQLQSSQLTALLQGAASGGQAASQLLGASSPGAGNTDGDSLLNTRLALLAAQTQARAPDHHQSQAQGGNSATLQSLLDSVSRLGSTAGGGTPPTAASGLQALLDSVARERGAGGAAGSHISGLHGFLDSAVRSGAFGSGSLSAPTTTGGLSDVQRAILQGSGLEVGRMGSGRVGQSLDGSLGSTSVSNGISEALRNYLQKNQNS